MKLRGGFELGLRGQPFQSSYHDAPPVVLPVFNGHSPHSTDSHVPTNPLVVFVENGEAVWSARKRVCDVLRGFQSGRQSAGTPGGLHELALALLLTKNDRTAARCKSGSYSLLSGVNASCFPHASRAGFVASLTIVAHTLFFPPRQLIFMSGTPLRRSCGMLRQG